MVHGKDIRHTSLEDVAKQIDAAQALAARLMTARQGNLLGFAACAGLLAYAYYAQAVLHLEPCPLCIFQRVGVFAVGLLFLIAAAHDPVAWGRRVYASLLAAGGARHRSRVALRHLYIQEPARGQRAGLRRVARFHAQGIFVERGAGQGADRLRRVRQGDLAISWDSAMPAWVLIAAAVLGVLRPVEQSAAPGRRYCASDVGRDTVKSDTLKLTEELIARAIGQSQPTAAARP